MELRQAFVKALEIEMDKNENICLLDADLAKATATLPLHTKYPERAFDVGVAEANMTSVAAGMASYGLIPFITTFGIFATRRNFDQAFLSVGYAGMNVKIVGTDPGITAELNGGTHMPLEDVALMRSIPNMLVFEPVDAVQMTKAMPQIVAHKGPVYIRLARKEQPEVFTPEYNFDLYKSDVLKVGKDVTLLASGIMLSRAIKASEILAEKGIDAEVINIHTLNPIDEQAILKSTAKTKKAVVCENHNMIGGLYSAIAELLSEKQPTQLKSVSVKNRFGEVGKLAELEKAFGLRVEDIVEACEEILD